MRSVFDFGAKGDGKTVDTLAIQAAIDTGGEVFIPKGTYITGTLYLKSNGGLNLEAGAVLKASHNRADYNADDYCPQNVVFKVEFVTGAHLISAVKQENIYIKGEGTIDGDSHYWMNDSHIAPGSSVIPPNPERIGQMIFLCECKNVSVTGISLKNASYWHLFLHGCEDVEVRGLNIKGEKKQFTNDGIVIDCCRRVTVSDCIIETGDDGITLRGYDNPLTEKKPCENITVTNCIISSHGDYGIRIGVGSGTIRNCLFSNIRIFDTHNGIGFTAYFALFKSGMAATIENINFENFIIEAKRPIEIRVASADGVPPAQNYSYIRGIMFSNIQTFGIRNNRILGYANSSLSDIMFIGCRFICGGKGKLTEQNDENGLWDNPTSDSMFEIRDTDNVAFNFCSFVFTEESKNWDYDATVTRSKNTVFNGCNMKKGINKV